MLQVLPITLFGDLHFMVVTVEPISSYSPRTMTISFFTSKGSEVTSWPISIPWDHAFPSVIPIDEGLVLITDPESQEVRLMDQHGNLKAVDFLFPDTDRDHEKVLAAAPSSQNHVYLGGMKSASLDQSDNVVLFSWNLDESPVNIMELPLTVLRDITISHSGFAAVSGTVTTEKVFNQEPRLILISLKNLTIVSYDFLPKKMLWVNDRLFAADNHQLIVIHPENKETLAEIQFDRKVIPLQLFTAKPSVHLLYAESSRYSEGIIELGDINILSINLQSFYDSVTSVSREYHKVVQAWPTEDDLFFLQLDGELLEYHPD